MKKNKEDIKKQKIDKKNEKELNKQLKNKNAKMANIKNRGLTKNEKARLVELKKKQKELNKKTYTVQESIPYLQMYEDGICRIDEKHYSKTIQFFDINYQLAQQEDQEEIFRKYLKLLNYFDDTVTIQFSFLNQKVRDNELLKNTNILRENDEFNYLREEYMDVIKSQMLKGNNGIVKTKYITFTIEEKSKKIAIIRLEKLEQDILANFKFMGVQTKTLNGLERLEILHKIFHIESEEMFKFSYDMIAKTGLSTKDFISPMSFNFGKKDTFKIDDMYGKVSYINLLVSEADDHILTDFLEENENLIINMHIKPINQVDAIKMIKRKLSDLQSMKINEQKKAAQNGYSIDIVSMNVESYGNDVRKLFESIDKKDEKLYMLTILVMNIGKNKTKLDSLVFQTKGITQKHNCELKCLDYRQEQGLMSSLPLGVNHINIDRCVNTAVIGAFMPFTTQELFTEGEAMYYGINAVSHNIIMADRKLLKTPNGLILGTPGSGKSFAAKREIVNVFLTTKDDIFVCDPEKEYQLLTEKLNGQVIKIAPDSKDYINPMDININYLDDKKPLFLKTNFIISLCELAVATKDGEKLTGEERSVIDRCTKEIYKPYLKEPIPENIPILEDLYNELRKQKEKEAQRIATILEIYVKGSLDIFNHKTNVDLNNRIVCFDIKDLGTQLKKIGMHIVQDQVWNRVTINRERKKSTRYYIDEAHLLMKEKETAVHFVEIWKRFRKWGGIPTAITQNTKDFLSSSEVENIFENSDFVYILNQATGDKKILAEKLNITENQLSYVTFSNEGAGLMFYGNVMIPFVDKFPHNSIYDLITTKPSEII